MRSSQGIGGKIPPMTWKRVLEALSELRPDQSREIERLNTLREISRYTLEGEGTDILRQEREALGAALDIFSGSNALRKKVLRSWTLGSDNITDRDDSNSTAYLSLQPEKKFSFLDGISSHYIQEDNPEAIGRGIADWYRRNFP